MHDTDETDEVLATRTQKGDADAFGVLVQRYENKIMRYANKFLYNYQDREDAVQEVFIKAYQHIQSFRPSQRFSPWIYRIAHNTFINVIRKQSREKVSYFDTDSLFALSLADTSEVSLREQKNDREILDQCLQKLSVKYREVLVLFYFEEKSYDEIADILHIPKATVGVRLARARAHMKNMYQSLH